jgi:hypothetical protein
MTDSEDTNAAVRKSDVFWKHLDYVIYGGRRLLT